MRKSLHRLLFVLVPLLAVRAAAQGNTGTLSGTIVDPQRQPVPGAAVTLTNEATGTTRTAVSGERGE